MYDYSLFTALLPTNSLNICTVHVKFAQKYEGFIFFIYFTLLWKLRERKIHIDFQKIWNLHTNLKLWIPNSDWFKKLWNYNNNLHIFLNQLEFKNHVSNFYEAYRFFWESSWIELLKSTKNSNCNSTLIIIIIYIPTVLCFSWLNLEVRPTLCLLNWWDQHLLLVYPFLHVGAIYFSANLWFFYLRNTSGTTF